MICFAAATVINNDGEPLTDASGKPAGPFNYGSGHLRPVHALDPGLVYNASYSDYLTYLCAMGIISNSYFKCPAHPFSPTNLNHPSIAIPNLNGTLTVKRTVTNVGPGKSVYSATVTPPVGVSVEISPKILIFSHVGEKKTFNITLQANEGNVGEEEKRGGYVFGWYEWKDGVHVVRSPMAVSIGD